MPDVTSVDSGDVITAAQAVRLCNALLQKVSAYETHQDYENKFADDLKTLLTPIYPNVEVYWTPGREKAAPTPLKQKENFREQFSAIIHHLNDDFHSHEFLSSLVKQTSDGQSHIFSISPSTQGLTFGALACDTIDTPRTEGLECNFKTEFVLTDPNLPNTPHSFVEQCRSEWQVPYSDLPRNRDKVRRFFKRWHAHNSQHYEQLKSKNASQKLLKRYHEAVQHFALMATYCAANDFQSVSLFLAPTIPGSDDSSMALFWPMSPAVPTHVFHSLLYMLLGLNASPVLYALAKAEAEEAKAKALDNLLLHFGHTMGHRVAQILRYFNGRTDVFPHAKRSAYILSGSMLLLQLSGFPSRKELLSSPKRSRYIAIEGEAPPVLDIYHLLTTEWRELIQASDIARTEHGSQVVRNVSLVFVGDAAQARLGFETDTESELKFRLDDSAYLGLFLELLLNVARYSEGHKQETNDGSTATLEIFVPLNWTKVAGNSVVALTNIIGDKDPPPYLKGDNKWNPWPDGRSHDGPGMAVSILRTHSMGNLWYRVDMEERSFSVAVHLAGFSEIEDEV